MVLRQETQNTFWKQLTRNSKIMGGKLLTKWNLEEKRLPDSEYQRLKVQIVEKLKNDFHLVIPRFLNVGVAPCVRDKKDHGDLDIIMSDINAVNSVFNMKKMLSNSNWNDVDSFSSYIQKEFGYVPHKNSNVYSFPVEGFQVDITLVPVEEYNTSISYTSWGDLGNLMGRIYHKMGLHYGHNGLSFWIRQGLFDNNVAWSDNDHVYDKLVITTDPNKIFEIGGFDYDRWLQGFDTEQDVWEFIIKSKYFNSEIFSLENLNNINRVRNKKRGMYMRFLEHVNDKTLPTGKQFLSKHEYGLIFQEDFHQLKSAIARYRHEYEVGKAIKEKFNGNLVHEWTGCSSGPGIGKIIKSVKDGHSNSSLLRMTPMEIKELVEKQREKILELVPDKTEISSRVVEDRNPIMTMAPTLILDDETCAKVDWANYYTFLKE